MISRGCFIIYTQLKSDRGTDWIAMVFVFSPHIFQFQVINLMILQYNTCKLSCAVILSSYTSFGSKITGYGSTLYIGMLWYLYSPHTFECPVLTFNFKLLMNNEQYVKAKLYAKCCTKIPLLQLIMIFPVCPCCCSSASFSP